MSFAFGVIENVICYASLVVMNGNAQ